MAAELLLWGEKVGGGGLVSGRCVMLSTSQEDWDDPVLSSG